MISSGVRLVGLEKWYGPVPALRSLDLAIDSGELVALLGPSGCGKTTALRLIAGLEDVTGGEIYIEGKRVNDVEPAERDIAMVFQNYALYPHMSVRDNLGFGLKMRRTPRTEMERRIQWAASVLGLQGLLARKPGQLSGGQRQRVALGRAMVREPSVFLFDEPLSNLDARLRLEMRAEIAELHQKLGTTMVFVTHDQVEAMTLGQRIAVLKDGELQQVGEPIQVYRDPENSFVAEFIGTPPINIVEGEISQEGRRSRFRAPGLELSLEIVPHSGPATLGIRAEALTLLAPDSEEVDLRTCVRRLEPLGNEVHVHFEGPSGLPWVARAGPNTRFQLGEPVGVRLDRQGVLLFAGEGKQRIGRPG